MTPLHLDILWHYYSVAGEYPMIPENQTRTEYAYQLASMGLLFTARDKRLMFSITKNGHSVVEKILSTFDEEASK